MNDPPSRSSQICQPSTWLVPCHTVGVQQWGYLEGLCKGYENWKLTCFFSENLSSFLPAPKNLSHFCGVVYFTKYILKGRFQWVFHEVWPQNRCKEDMREDYTLKIILVPGRGDSHGIPSFYGFHVSWTKKKITNLNCLRESLVIPKKTGQLNKYWGYLIWDYQNLCCWTCSPLFWGEGRTPNPQIQRTVSLNKHEAYSKPVQPAPCLSKGWSGWSYKTHTHTHTPMEGEGSWWT